MEPLVLNLTKPEDLTEQACFDLVEFLIQRSKEHNDAY